MSFLSRLKNIDNRLIEMYVNDVNKSNYDVPEIYRSVFCRIAGASEFSYVFQDKFLEGVVDAKVLVVGLHGGRDYWAAVARGWDVYGMDINDFDFPNVKSANAEEQWPYDDSCFDVVIMGEVLEHLFFDKEALLEAGRVMKPDGRLIVTVPFLDSNDEFHVRMHDRRTIGHLLEFSSFSIVDVVERPGLFFKPFLNYVNSFVVVLVFFVLRINLYHKIIPLYGEIEYSLGKKKMFRSLLKVAGGMNYGASILAVKSDVSNDYIEMNKKKFSQ